MIKEPGSKYRVNKVGIGFGKKYDFTQTERKEKTVSPGPQKYSVKNSISYLSSKLPKAKNGFYNKYDKYEGICYQGMEKAFYLKGSPGVGSYMGNEMISHSLVNNASRWNFPKKDRGLLRHAAQKSPGPHEYNNDSIITKTLESRFKIPMATRDIPFSKYGSLHSELVTKGLH